MKRLKTIFFGTPEFAVPALEGTAAGSELLAVYSQPDRRAGRGKRLTRPPVALAAEALGVPVRQPERARGRTFREELEASGAELAVVVAYGELFRPRVLESLPLGFYNLHASLLPRWRGPSPIQAAIAAGDRETGVCCFRLVPAMDAGPMLTSRAVPIPPDATGGELHDTLSELGRAVIGDALSLLAEAAARGEPPALTPQDDAQVTVCQLLSKRDGELDWRRPAFELRDLIRAMTPWPGASTRFELDGKEQRLQLLEAEVCPRDKGAEPGQRLPGEGLAIACGEDALRLRRLKPAGRGPMDADAYLRGRELPADLRFRSPSD